MPHDPRAGRGRDVKFAYADPPYLGCGASHYGYPEWDDPNRHVRLVTQLVAEYPDGWALSCNPRDLIGDGWLAVNSRVLPDDARMAAWTKTWHRIRPTTVQYAWESVIFCGGRKDGKRPMVRDWLSCAVTRQTGLRGAKPDQFNDWILALLNYEPGDVLDDLFPGTGGMARAIERANWQLRPRALDGDEGAP